MNGPSASDRGQRWENMRVSWAEAGRDGFRPDDYTVEPIDKGPAETFVLRHHYSGSFPADVLRYGLLAEGELVGVAILSSPQQEKVLTNVFPELPPYKAGVVGGSLELGRFVLLDDVPGNGESWFLARAFEQAQAAGLAGVVSFSDPRPRQIPTGTIVPGHVGTIYQASNAAYLGRATPRSLTILPDGSVLGDRAKQKIRGRERGHRYAAQLLIDQGARPPRNGQDPRLWLAEALVDVGARRVYDRGKHRYAFRLGRNARERRQIQIALPQAAYPKIPDGHQDVLL